MARIYRTTDKIPVKIGELVFKISPLSILQKSEVEALIISGELTKAAYIAVKYAIKSVDGLEDENGKYEIEFDENGHVTDACLDDFSNMEGLTNLHVVCLSLLNGIPKHFVNPETGKKLDGVDFVEKESSGKKSKKAG